MNEPLPELVDALALTLAAHDIVLRPRGKPMVCDCGWTGGARSHRGHVADELESVVIDWTATFGAPG